MSAPVLTLPAPAAELWNRIAPAVRDEIGRITGGEPQYAIGGGSILAARWKHRHSYDVDLVVPPDTPLGMLATANNPASQFEPRLRALGGTPTFSSELGMWRVSFDRDERKLDLWATAPLFGAGERASTIDGRLETVLSSAQILRGKLERSEEHLTRDVYDIAKASDKEPEALEAAINAISRELAEGIAQSFHWASPTIAAEAEDALGGVSPEERIEGKHLGIRAAHAVSEALYTLCRIATRGGAIEITTRTGARGESMRRIDPANAEHDFEAAGLNAYLHTRGPGGKALVDYARTACRANRDSLVFEADAEGVRAWRTATAAMNLSSGAANEQRDPGSPRSAGRG